MQTSAYGEHFKDMRLHMTHMQNLRDTVYYILQRRFNLSTNYSNSTPIIHVPRKS